MGWHKHGRRGYHHGNLRQALIDAALKLIASKGPAGFTFAEAARSAGVSPAAPYRHFRDKDALMADVAAEGFATFARALRAGAGKGKDPRAALMAMGRAYLDFARSEPAYYAAMFEAGLKAADHPETAKAGDDAFAALREAVEALVATHPGTNRPPVLMVALQVWALAHGIASLFNRGDGASRAQPIEPNELLESAVLIYLDGLGFGGLHPSTGSG